MRNTEINFFMFIAAIVFGVLISINLNIGKVNEKMTLTEYQQSYEDRTKLISEIKFLKDQNSDLNSKILEYKKTEFESKEASDILKEELLNNKMLLGTESVQGEGLIIKLEDGDTENNGQVVDSFIRKQRTIHDNDITELLNDIKLAGAQAISINNRRVIYNTSVYCAGQFLVIDGFKTPTPFYIKLIGDPKLIEASLISENSTLKKLMNRGIKINLKIENSIKIPKYTTYINYSNIEK